MARNMARHSNRQRMSGLLSSFARGALTKFRSPPRKCISPIILPPDVPLEEEELPRYNAKNFYPVNPGDRLVDRYETTAKLGYGESATVWLARDIRPYAESSSRHCNTLIILQLAMAV